MVPVALINFTTVRLSSAFFFGIGLYILDPQLIFLSIKSLPPLFVVELFNLNYLSSGRARGMCPMPRVRI